MAAVTLLLVVGSLTRITVLVLRPPAAHRFGQPQRRLLASRLEQGGDLVVLATAVWMILAGYGRHPSVGLVAIWAAALLAGFAAVLFAHAVARNDRTAH